LARRRGRPLVVWLDDDAYALLRARCESEEIHDLPECAALLLRWALEARGQQAQPAPESLVRRLERVIQDILNPYTAKLDEIYRRLGEIYELIESGSGERGPPPPSPPPVSRGETASPRQSRRGASAIDRLKEEGVFFEEDAKWLRAPERFFQKLEREGAIVLSIHGEHIAVDPDFWEGFLAELENLEVSSLEDAADILSERLGDKAGRLLEALARAGLAYFDETSGRWRISERLIKP